jgi:hypothetical protein
VLVMLDKGRTQELTSLFTRQMAETLTSARHNLGDAPGTVDAMEARFPCASVVLPNVANAFRTSGEYLERKGGYPEAVADAKWLVAASSRPGDK